MLLDSNKFCDVQLNLCKQLVIQQVLDAEDEQNSEENDSMEEDLTSESRDRYDPSSQSIHNLVDHPTDMKSTDKKMAEIVANSSLLGDTDIR